MDSQIVIKNNKIVIIIVHKIMMIIIISSDLLFVVYPAETYPKSQEQSQTNENIYKTYNQRRLSQLKKHGII